MKWLPWLRKDRQEDRDEALRSIQSRFATFLLLLDTNNRLLKCLSDLELKARGGEPFTTEEVRESVTRIRFGAHEIVRAMIELGGPGYEKLRDRLEEIEEKLDALLQGRRLIQPDAFTRSFDQLDRSMAGTAGRKNANLAELRNRLGLPVPDGFAITAWSYRHFIESNDLQSRITECMEKADLERIETIDTASESIRSAFLSSPVPEDLAREIEASFRELESRSGARGFALRSSAIGEDGRFSFAGQYATFLNVQADKIVARYREALAGKFTPKAIYYLLSHGFHESELAMAVGCLAMVDAEASGVLYTRDPLRPDDDVLVIHSIYGLGPLLVNGTVTPDVFRVDRASGQPLAAQIARKAVRLLLSPDSGTVLQPVPVARRDEPSLTPEKLGELAELGRRVEKHQGGPQDIEWALDSNDRIVLLQARPLRVLQPRDEPDDIDVSSLKRLAEGGTTVCPGAGSGPVHHAKGSADLLDLPEGAVLVAEHPFPGLVAAFGKVAALVTEVGGAASHMATLAREYGVPTLTGLEDACRLPAAAIVTVDATGTAVYEGRHPDLIQARDPRLESSGVEDERLLDYLQRVLVKLAPLNLVHPADASFRMERCETLHDITRYAHQMAMQVIFEQACDVSYRERLGFRLRTGIPMQVNVFYLDEEPRRSWVRWIEENEIRSEPMRAFWSGIREEPWPMPPESVRGLKSRSAIQMSEGARASYSENSCAILSPEYMIVSLRMGYHFTTVEAMSTSEPGKNFIRMQYKQGGPALDRRIRRIRLIADILTDLGFENSSQGDFLDSIISYVGQRLLLERLRMLGRLIIMTKQLDMALQSDDIAEWYSADIRRRLGLETEGRGEP